MDFLYVLLIIGIGVGLIIWWSSRNNSKTDYKVPEVPASHSGTMGSYAGSAGAPPRPKPPTAPPQSPKPPQASPDPVIPIFEDKQYRPVYKCPGCDGENPHGTMICCVCGRRL